MPILSIIILLLTLGGLIAASAILMNNNKINGESARKMVHVGMGLICLAFPLLFSNPLFVQLLAGLAVISLLALRLTPLRVGIGSSLFSISRISIGEIIFPIAVAWLFTLNIENNKQPVIYYVIPLLLLTLADTVAAMAGSKYGKLIYLTASGKKSIEGSLAFFTTAYLCTFIPLYYFTNYELTHVAFIALISTLFITAVEGISGIGMDNILIPIGSYFLLDYYTALSTYSLWVRVASLLILLSMLIWTRSKHRLNGGAVLSASLLCFISFSIGGTYCLIACIMIFIRHIMAIRKIPTDQQHTHSLDTILAISVPAMTWLTLGKNSVIDMDLARSLFIASLAITIAMLHASTHKYIYKQKITKYCIFKSLCMSSILIVITFLFMDINSFIIIFSSTLSFSLLGCISFYKIRSTGVPTISDWAILCLFTIIFTTIIYYCHENHHALI